MAAPKTKATKQSAVIKRKLTPEEVKTVHKISPEHKVAAIESLTYVPMEFKTPEYVPITKDTDELALCVNQHRNTCIRISIGNKKVTFIPMEAEGIMVKRCGIDAFNEEWRLALANHSPVDAAHQYLNSYAAMRHISEEARAFLVGIISKGANQNHIIVKENQMNTTATTTKSKKATTPAVVKATAAKTTAKATKPAAKAPVKAAPAAKATAKVAKPAPAAKGKAAEKPAGRASIDTAENKGKLKKLLASGITNVADLAEELGICKRSVRKLMSA